MKPKANGKGSVNHEHTRTLRGRPLPSGWVRREGEAVPVADDGAGYYNAAADISVVESVAREVDGRLWHHVSVARGDRMPSWDDLAMVKRVWMGHDTYAIQVVPPTSRHVNIHPYCLHLWSCDELGTAILPDFTRGGRTI